MWTLVLISTSMLLLQQLFFKIFLYSCINQIMNVKPGVSKPNPIEQNISKMSSGRLFYVTSL